MDNYLNYSGRYLENISEITQVHESFREVIGIWFTIILISDFNEKCKSLHFRFYYLLLLVTVPSFVLLSIPESIIAFMEVLLMLLLPIALTFGNFTTPGFSCFLIPFPLLFIIAVLLIGLGGLALLFEGIFVLLFLVFLLSFALSYLLISFVLLSSLDFSASFRATALAIFLICWWRLLRHPKKLRFLNPFLILLLFL